MEEILLRLVCEEYEISEELLFSDSRHDVIYKPLSMMTYILRIKYNWKVSNIYSFYRKKGYTKTKAALYNHLKAVINDIYYNEYSRIACDSIIDSVEKTKRLGTIVDHEGINHFVMGRIVHKIYSIKNYNVLKNVERQIDTYLQTQFIKEGQFEEV